MSATITPGDRPGSLVLWLDGMRQSEVDPADPTWLAFDYMRRIADVLDEAAPPGEPIRVVHVGGAAMALPRYVAHTRPRSGQVVLEPDAALVEDVRRLLPLPPRSGIKVRVVDGLAGMPAIRDASADVVVVDAFAGGEVPRELVSRAFLADVRRALTEGGLLAVNLSDRAPFPLVREAVAGLRELFTEVTVGAEPATLKGRRAGNLVVVAGGSVPGDALAARARSGGSPYRLFTGTAVLDSFGGGRAPS